ncbi:MAG TPA: aldehyde dehydrogenase family protein [Candidatus Eisenbacteria bacterium]|nr:aldehyde dehydrogenase family protein [Candidatus Eisenbacteria bacterium]
MAATSAVVDTVPSIDPATGKVVKSYERTSPLAVPQLIARTRDAQREWAKRPVAQRCAQLRALKEKILESRELLTEAVVRESGKPRAEAKFADVFVSLDSADYFSKYAPALLKAESVSHHSLAAKAKSGKVVYEPLGVVAIISSWNYPLAIPMSQITAAVAAGNGVVCKASDFTPECGDLIGKLFRDAGFPADLVTILQGGGEVGQALIEARPDKVLFTGSVFTGRHVAEACAPLLIPSVLELGGKDAMLVLADANMEVASSAAVWGSYTNCGQVCLSVERLFVEETVSEAFIGKCVEKTGKLQLGPGSNAGTDVGPMIRPQHVQRMSELLADAVRQGAKVLCGGRPRPDLGPNFFEPTVITGVDASMKLFQDETFGPIMAIRVVKDAEEAVRLANASEFTLSASVWTRNAKQGRRIARELRVGVAMVNDLISGFAIAEAPHGGCGLSGWGRTHGQAGFREMVHLKYVDEDRLPGMEKPWWYRYGGDLENAADAFLKFEFSSKVGARLRYAQSALKTIFREHGLK